MKPDSSSAPVETSEYIALQKQVFDGSDWLTGGDIDYARAKLGLKEVHPREWERSGRVFSVLHEGRHYYPTYLLNSSYEPLPIVKAVLDAYGEFSDSWEVAIWLHFPNGWIVNETRCRDVPLAPKDALSFGEQIISAARNRRGTYIA